MNPDDDLTLVIDEQEQGGPRYCTRITDEPTRYFLRVGSDFFHSPDL